MSIAGVRSFDCQLGLYASEPGKLGSLGGGRAAKLLRAMQDLEKPRP